MANLAKASKPIKKILRNYSVKLLFSLVVFSLVISGSIAGGPHGTLTIPKCASYCSESSKFNYDTKSIFIYDYSTEVSTYVVHGSSGESRVHLLSKVEVIPITKCDFELKLKDVKLEESELQNPSQRKAIVGSDMFVQELEQKTLQFAFQNGKIDSICADDSETVWSLNVKRGILSMLQSTMDKDQSIEKEIQEVDVNGKCLTTYSMEERTNETQIIQRTKNLKSCNHRHSHISGIQSIPYVSNSPIQSIPLLTGTQKCTQVVTKGKITLVECQEEHKFQPFDYINSGAETKVVQKLNFVQQVPNAIHTTSNEGDRKIRKTGLLFETENQENSFHHNLIDHILKFMEKLEEKNMANIRPDAPEVFLQLIELLRAINLPSLKLLDSKASEIGKVFLLDALPLVGTSPALSFMRDLYLEAQLLDDQVDAWLTSLVFIKNPNIEMIAALQPLLISNPKPQAMFGISSMVNAYCREHEHCTTNSIVIHVLRRFYHMLDNCELSNEGVHHEKFLRILYALKSIGNAGRLVPLEGSDVTIVEAQKLIEKCYQKKSNPMEIKLASIDSFRRMTCGSYNQHSLVKLLKDSNENTEVRIQAYLTLMRCPDSELISNIKDIFFTDSVNQVVSFMWTHLTNLQETASPDKQAIRELLSNDELKHKFSSDARKYSRNYEGSKYWKNYNVGVGYDANLIFSPESFIPRSAMINLTSHLFGESINMLEFGVRVHSMEHLLEPIFGPAGYFPDQTVNQALHTMRVRRDVANQKSDRLSSIYDQAALEINDPGGSFYTRVFGNEITAKTFQISHKDRTVPTVIDENGKNWLDLTHWLDNLSKGKSMDYTKSNLLMDISYTVPTSAGLPLTLNLQSATTVGINANGKIDMVKFWEHKELDIQGKLNPSASIQVFGTMVVNIGPKASNVKSGLKIENTLHSSTSVEGRVLMKNGKLTHASLGLPKDKQEIFEAKSELYLVKFSGEKVQEKGATDVNRIAKKMCTPKVIDTILGIKVCGELNAPESFTSSLFKSPASCSVVIEKTDTFNSYEFEYKWDRETDKTDIALFFDTPGSKINRKVALNYTYDLYDGIFKIGIEAPTKSLNIDGNYQQNSQKFQFSAVSNNKRLLFMNAELKRQNLHIEPNLVVLYYDKPIIEIDGSVVNFVPLLEGNGKSTFDLNVKHLTPNRINFNGELTREDDTLNTNIGILSKLLTGNFKSQLRLNPNALVTKVDVDYSLNGSLQKKSYNMNGKIQKSIKGLLTKYHTIYSFSSTDGSIEPTNFDFTWDLQSGNSYCDNTVKVTLGKEIWNGKVLYSNQMSRTHKDLRFELLLDAPKRNVDYNFVLSHQEADNGFTSKAIIKLNSKSEFKAHVGYLVGKGWLLKRNFIAGITWNELIDYSVKASIEEGKPGEFDGEITINTNTNSNQQQEMKGTISYKNRSSNNRIDHSMEFRSRGFNATIVSGSFALIASEKLSRIGGQLDIEGVENYSGRWSSSLNYSAPKRNIRKIEGKLTLQDKKYNGVLNYKRTRNGDRTIVMDLNLKQRIFMQAQMSGSWPSPINTYLTIIPDKTTKPEYNISCQGTIDPKSINIRVDYFGQIAQFVGNYDQRKGQIETHWVGNQQMRLSFDISKFSLSETTFIVNFESPFMENFGISLQHSLSRRHVTTQMHGNMGERRSSASITGNINSPESQLSIVIEPWQSKKVQVQLRRFRTSDQAIMDFNIQLGEENTNLRLEHSRTNKGINCKVEFDGCSFVPKVAVGFSQYEMSSGYVTDVDIGWTPQGESKNIITMRLEEEEKPWNYVMLVTTPWTPFNKFEIGLTTELDTKLMIDLTVSGTYDLFPIRMKLKSDGEFLNSDYELLVSWTENEITNPINIFGTTKIENWRNARINAAVALFEHKYAMDISSHKGKHDQKMEVGWSVDGDETKAGLTWQCEKRGNLVKVTGWLESPTQPRFFIDYHHLNDEDYFTLVGQVKEGEKTLGQIVTEFHSTGFEHWEITAKLNSVLNVIPTISFTSHHSIEDLNEIRHTTEFLLSENNMKLWGGLEETKILLEFNLKNGRDLSGSVKVNGKEIKLVGVLENESASSSEELQGQQAQRIDLEISSQLFEPIHTIAEYQVEYDNHAISIGFSGSRSGTKFIGLELNGKNDVNSNVISGYVNILCPFEHQIEGKGTLDFKHLLVDISLKETMKNALSIAVSGQAQPTNGHLNIEFNSQLDAPLNFFKIETAYKTENYQKFELNGKYLDNIEEASINAVYLWKHHHKKLQLLLNKGEKVDFKVEFRNSKDFLSYLTLDQVQIYNVDANYQVTLQDEEFGMGKHVIGIKFKMNDELYNIIGTLGLGTNHVMFNTQTPLKKWKNWTLDAKMTGLKVKTLNVVLENHETNENYFTTIEYGDGTIAFSLQTPIESWSNVEAKLKYQVATEELDASFFTAWEENTISIITKLTKSSVDFNVQTPYEPLTNLAVSSKWNVDNQIKTFETYFQLNQETHEIFGEYQFDFSKGHLKIVTNTPIIGDYKLGINYDFVQDIQAIATFETGNSKKYEVVGKIIFGYNEIEFQLQSPLQNMESLSLKLQYQKPKSSSLTTQIHSAAAEWNVNGKSDSITAEVNLQPGNVEITLITPFKNWNQLKGALVYELHHSFSKMIEVTLEKQQKRYISLKTEFSNQPADLNSFVNSNKLSISIQTTDILPVGYENLKLVTEYQNSKSNYHTISIHVHRNNLEIIQSKVNFQLEFAKDKIAVDVNGELFAPSFGIQLSSLNGTYLYETNPNSKILQLSFVKKQRTLVLNEDDPEFAIKVSYQWTPTQIKLQVQTPFKPIRNVHIDGHYEPDGRIGSILEFNKKKVEINGQLSWNGLKNFMITSEIKTPFNNFKLIHAQLNSKILSQSILIDYILQNDNVRYMGRIDGSQDLDGSAGQLQIQLNSPISKMEQVLTAINYNDSGIYMRVERNRKEEVTGFMLLDGSNVLKVSLHSKVTNYPIDLRSSIAFNGFLPNIHIAISSSKLMNSNKQLNAEVNIRDGFSFGEININSSIALIKQAKLNWEVTGNPNDGEAKISWDLLAFATTKSIRTAWKNDKFQNIKLQGWYSSPKDSHEKGFNVEFTFSPFDMYGNNGKFGASVTYLFDKKEQQVTISTSLKKNLNSNTMELNLKTPFDFLKQFSLSGRLTVSPEIVLDLSANVNQLKAFTSNIVTYVSPLSSKLKFSLNAPLLIDSFNLNAAYDLTTVDKVLDISFMQNKYQLNMKAQAIVPTNPDEIELRIMVDSNVPSVTVTASGSLRAGYKIQTDNTRQIIVSINSEPTGLWKVTGSLRPVFSDFDIKFKLDSPIPERIPAITTEILYKGSIMENLNTELFIHVGHFQPIKATLGLSYQMISANFMSGIPGLEHLAFDGSLDLNKNDVINHKFHFGLKSGKDNLIFEGDIQIPAEGHFAKGSVKMSSTWNSIPTASLGVNVATNGTIDISGMWGSRQINIRGTMHKSNEKSSPWSTISTDFALSLNAEEIFHIQSRHYFSENEKSLNVTMDDKFKLTTYLKSNPQFNSFFSTVQWASHQQVDFVAEVGAEHFNASLKTPWTSDIDTHGEYKVSAEDMLVKGICIINGQPSKIEATVSTTEKMFNSRINLDVPLLSQKMEANVKIMRPDEHYTEGSIDMKLKDRRIAVKGSLSTNTHTHADNIEMDENVLKISIALPTKRNLDINGEFSWKQPKAYMNKLQFESAVTIGLHTAKGRFHYQIPSNNSNSLAVGFVFDAPFLSEEKYDGLIDITNINPLHFNGEIHYKANSLAMSWDIEEIMRAKIAVNLPNVLQEHNPLVLEAKGNFKLPELIQLETTISCHTQILTTRFSVNDEVDSFRSSLFIHSPTLISAEPTQLTLKISKTPSSSSHSRILELTTTHGKESFSATGEVVFAPNKYSTSLKLSGYFGDHFINFVISNEKNLYEVELNAESMTLIKGKKVSILGRFLGRNENEFDSILECRTRQATHTISLNFNKDQQHGIVTLKLESPYVKAVSFESEYSMESDLSALSAKLSANIMNRSHVMKFGYDLKYFDAYLNIVSPLLTSQIFNVQFKSKLKENHVDILGDVNVFGTEWKLETKGIFQHHQHFEAKLEIKTPFESVRRITIETVLSKTKIHFEFYTPIDDLPNFVFGISDVPLFGQIDLTNFKPQIIVGLPWVTYSTAAIIQFPSKVKPGEVSFVFSHGPQPNQLKEFKFTAQISPIESLNVQMDSPVQVTLKISTPLTYFNTFECKLGGRINLKSWSEINLSGEFNGKEVGISSEIQREETNKKFLIQLKTPYENYEQTTFSVRLEDYEEIGTGKNIQVDFKRNRWENPIRLELDYHYRVGEYPLNSDGELTFYFPSNSELPPLHLNIKSKAMGSIYNGILEGHWGQWQPSFKVDFGYNTERIFGCAEVKLEDTPYQSLVRFDFQQQSHEISILGEVQLSNEQLFFANMGFLQKHDIVKCNILFKTPFEDFSSVAAELRLSPLSRTESVTLEQLLHTLDISLGVTFNHVKLFQFELISKNNQRSLEIHNPIQPISFIVSYRILPNKKLEVTSSFCWDLAKPVQNTVGIKFNYAKNVARNEILLTVQGGEYGSMTIDTSHEWSQRKLEQYLQFKWDSLKLEQNTSFGYYALLEQEFIPSGQNVNTVLRLDFPSRSIQFDHHENRQVGHNNNKVTNTNIEFKWDAIKNPTKRIGITSTYESVTIRRQTTYKSTWSIAHSALAHNLIFEIEKAFKNNKLSEAQFVFKPNSFSQDQFTVRISHENMQGKGVQIMLSHPTTNIDINAILSHSDATSLLHMAYLDVRGERHVVHAEITRTIQNQVYEFSTGSNVHNLIPLFKLEIINSKENEKEIKFKSGTVQIDSVVRTGLPYLEARVQYDAGEELALTIGLPNKKKIILQAVRNEFGQNIQDLFMIAKFNNSDTLSTALFWRPGLLNDLHQLASINFPSLIANSIDDAVSEVLERADEEIEIRLNIIDPGLNRVFTKLKNYIAKEFTLIHSEVVEVEKYILSLYNNNKFYMKDILQMIGKTFRAAGISSSKLFQFIVDGSAKTAKLIANCYEKMRLLSANYSGQLKQTVMNIWKSAEESVANTWKYYKDELNKILSKGRGLYDTINAAIEGNMDILEKKIYGIDLIKKLLCLYEDYTSWLEQLPVQGYVAEMKELLKEKVLKPLEKYYNPYFTIISKAIEDGNLYGLLEMPPMPYVRYVAINLSNFGAGFWKFVEAEERIRDLVGDILDKVNNLIQRHFPLTKLTVEVEKGHLEYHQPLTFLEWQDFTHLPKWKVPENDEEDISQINEIYYSLLDTLRTTQPFREVDFRKMLPPFGSNALMAGDYHYLTFDKKYFRFAGECSYILVADLVNQNFTLAANYENVNGNIRKKSYSLMTGDKVIEFDTKNLKVTLDGRKMELPLEVGTTFIRRQSSALEIFDKRGFKMQCSMNGDTCTVSVSGWYFGKLGGLLGTYDNEPNNDFKTPDGQIVDVATFAHSWRVGSKSGQCRMRNFARELPHYEDADGICHEHLTSLNSQLRVCFNEVATAPFVEMCKYDTTMNLNSVFRREAACTALSAYVTQCQHNGVDLWLPPTCVSCKLEDGSSIFSGENVTIGEDAYVKPPMSSDIIILIEEAPKLKDFNILTAINKLDNALRNEGLTNNRYAVVGYGGSGAYFRPHIRTSSGQVWSSNTLLKFSDTFPMNGKENGDLFEAIEYGSSIGFRTGVSKNIIAFIAEDESSKGDNRKYTDTLTLLIENDIKLNILSPDDLTLKGNKREDGNKLFGFDLKGIFTLWQSKRGSIESDRTLRRYVNLPRDLYTPLAMETTGTRFNMNFMKSSFSKIFLDVWSRLVAKESKPSKCQYCECVPDKFGGSLKLCQQCVSPSFKIFLENWDEIRLDENQLPTTTASPETSAESFDFEHGLDLDSF